MQTFRDVARYLGIYHRYIGRRMYLVFGLVGLTSLAQGFGITLLLPLLRVSQSVETAENLSTAEKLLYELLGVMGIADSALGILAFIAVVFIAKGGLQFVKKGYVGYLKSRLLRELEMKLFDAYAEMDYQYYVQQHTGHFVNVINQQVERFFRSFSRFNKFLTQAIMMVSYFGFAFAIAWRFALMAVAVGVVLVVLFKRLNTYVRDLSRLRSSEMSQLNRLLMQTLQSFKYIVSTNHTRHLRSGVTESVGRLSTNTMFDPR
jgi:subfamily B ATP-binding cassette protein MsbA